MVMNVLSVQQANNLYCNKIRIKNKYSLSCLKITDGCCFLLHVKTKVSKNPDIISHIFLQILRKFVLLKYHQGLTEIS